MNKSTGGGYSGADFNYSTRYTSQTAQSKANTKLIKQRLHDFGAGGYLKFLIQKNYNNTSDGTLGWLKEGDFFDNPSYKQHKFIKSFFYPYGSRVTIYQTVVQLIWIGVVVGLLLSFLDRSFLTRFLRLSQFGLLLFLLFFEGGRTRYIIQLLPVTYMLAVIGWSRFSSLTGRQKVVTINWRRLRGVLLKIL